MISNSITSRPASSLVATYTTSESKAQGDSTAKPSTQISTLASQLAASAARADVRDKTLSRTELADHAKKILDQTVGDSYYANKKRHDNEVPKTDNSELLARAKQATAYLNDAAQGGSAIKNPFSGLSREQLSHIVYDESGTFTVNERHSAWRESYYQEEAWRQQVCAKAMNEYNSTGKLTQFFSSCLDHFKQLPSIEQAQYPADYASDLQSKVDLDFNYRTHQAEGKRNSPQSLIDAVLPMQSKEPTSPKPAAQDKGMAIVNQRLYGGQAKAPVLSPRTDFNNASSPTQFLTLEDRKILGEMYDFAQQEGAELHHVDAIAISLGAYRSFSDGKIMGNFNSGLNSDLQGHVLTVDFSEKDAAIAARIRNSDAINCTKIDRGFLDYSLDPGFGALSNHFDLDFMEKMVNKFSDQGAAVTLDAKFAKYEPTRIEQKVRYTKSAEVVFQPVVADYSSVDGAGHWRTPELAAAAEGRNSSSPNQPAQLAELIKSVLDKIRTSDRDNLMLLHRFELNNPTRRTKPEE